MTPDIPPLWDMGIAHSDASSPGAKAYHVANWIVLATMDAEGYFAIVDRRKDMINTAGFKVWPREVEETLYAHEAVRLAMVIGVPDDYRGEAVKACVVVKDSHRGRVTEADLAAFCKSRLTTYKVPRTIEFRDTLPQTTNGKMLRRALREE